MNKDIALRVIAAKDDAQELNQLIEEYKPFIASCVQSSTKKFVEYGRDEELSIGLIAFHEAIKCYDQNKGNFLTFARHVIKRRLIDYYRSQNKFNYEVAIDLQLSATSDDIEYEHDLTVEQSIQHYAAEELARLRRLEIKELQEELEKWGIQFHDVAHASPKRDHTRKRYLEIVDYIIENQELKETILNKRYLPISKICEGIKVDRKKVERARNYLVAAVLIRSGNYEFLQDFVDWR